MKEVVHELERLYLAAEDAPNVVEVEEHPDTTQEELDEEIG